MSERLLTVKTIELHVLCLPDGTKLGEFTADDGWRGFRYYSNDKSWFIATEPDAFNAALALLGWKFGEMVVIACSQDLKDKLKAFEASQQG